MSNAKSKRCLAVFMALILCLNLLSVAAFAEDSVDEAAQDAVGKAIQEIVDGAAKEARGAEDPDTVIDRFVEDAFDGSAEAAGDSVDEWIEDRQTKYEQAFSELDEGSDSIKAEAGAIAAEAGKLDGIVESGKDKQKTAQESVGGIVDEAEAEMKDLVDNLLGETPEDSEPSEGKTDGESLTVSEAMQSADEAMAAVEDAAAEADKVLEAAQKAAENQRLTDAEKSEVEQQVKDLEQTVEDSRNALTQAEADCAAAAEAVEALREELAEKLAEAQQAVAGAKAAFEAELAALQDQLTNAQTALKEAFDALQSEKARLDGIEAKVIEAQSALKGAAGAAETVESALSQQLGDLEDAVKAEAKAQYNEADARDELAAAEARRGELEEKQKSATENLEKARTNLNSAEANLEAYEEKMRTVAENLRAYEEKLKAAEENFEKKGPNDAAALEWVTNARASLEKAQKWYDDTEASLEEAKVWVTNAKTSFDTAEEWAESVKTSLAAAEAWVTSATARVGRAEKALEDAKATREDLTAGLLDYLDPNVAPAEWQALIEAEAALRAAGVQSSDGKDLLEAARGYVDRILGNYNEAKNAAETAESAYQEALGKVKEAQEQLDALRVEGKDFDEEAYAELQNELTNAQRELAEKQAALEDAEKTYEKAGKALSDAQAIAEALEVFVPSDDFGFAGSESDDYADVDPDPDDFDEPDSTPNSSFGSVPNNTLITLEDEAVPLAALPAVFADVSDEDWFSDAVKFVVGAGLMKGTDEGTFAPDNNVTRAAFAAILHRMENEPAAELASFLDVAADAWFAGAAAWSSANGIIDGSSDTEFGAGALLTREQIAVILYRYAQYKSYDVSDSCDITAFVDGASISDGFSEGMAWCVAAGILSDDGSNALNPTGYVTRGEIAVMLMRFCQKYTSEA